MVGENIGVKTLGVSGNVCLLPDPGSDARLAR